jgi:hypothetical protein
MSAIAFAANKNKKSSLVEIFIRLLLELNAKPIPQKKGAVGSCSFFL